MGPDDLFLIDSTAADATQFIVAIMAHIPRHYTFEPLVVNGARVLCRDASLWIWNRKGFATRIIGLDDFVEITTFMDGAEIDRQIYHDAVISE
jgi:hypothetical protein